MMCQKHLEGLVVPDPSTPRASYSVDTEAGSAEVVFPHHLGPRLDRGRGGLELCGGSPWCVGVVLFCE